MQHKVIGTIIRIERLKQERKQSELCNGICVPSYLSKIEHGQVAAEKTIITRLFKKLGIDYRNDDAFVTYVSDKISAYFKALNFNMDHSSVFATLEKDARYLPYSIFAIDWLIIQALEHEDVTTIELLSDLEDLMTRTQHAYFTIIRYFTPHQKDFTIEMLREACDTLNTSFGQLNLCMAYMLEGNYVGIHQLENRLTALALEEGNTYRLAEYFSFKGHAYACLNQHQLMMVYYERAINLLQNTGWTAFLNTVYYNIGATYINLKDYDLSLKYLNMVEETEDLPSFTLLHKKAIVHIRMGNIDQGREFLRTIETEHLSKKVFTKADQLKYEEARFECEDGFISNPDYLILLEKLILELKKTYHFGHLNFYTDIIIEAYKANRKYKKALAFEQEVSRLTTKNVT